MNIQFGRKTMIGRGATQWFTVVGTVIGSFLIAGLLIISNPLFAQTSDADLFRKAAKQPTDQEAVNPALVIRQRFVTVLPGAFSEDREIANVLHLNLFDDVRLTGIQDRLEKNTSGGWVWIGHLDGIADSAVTLVFEGQKISGAITLPDRLYHIRNLENELHVVREIDPFALPGSTRPSLSDEADVQAPAANPLAQEEAVFDLVNQERAVYGLHLLSWDDRLFAAARGHSEDMAANGYFSHTSLDGRSPWERILEAGYYLYTGGENIAYGYPTAESVMSGWMNSPGHRANILGSSFCDLGVGLAIYSTYHYYWTQDFARELGVYVCPTPEPEGCWSDFNNDGNVDESDLAALVSFIGRTNCDEVPLCEGDFDSDGDVDSTDLAEFEADFGKTDCP
jgi:uncharacterized protein YkwD